MKVFKQIKRISNLIKNLFLLSFDLKSNFAEKFFAIEAGILAAKDLLSDLNRNRTLNQAIAHGPRISSRSDFLRLIPKNGLALEIGPFDSPLLFGHNVRFCDVLDQSELQKRAKSI